GFTGDGGIVRDLWAFEEARADASVAGIVDGESGAERSGADLHCHARRQWNRRDGAARMADRRAADGRRRGDRATADALRAGRPPRFALHDWRAAVHRSDAPVVARRSGYGRSVWLRPDHWILARLDRFADLHRWGAPRVSQKPVPAAVK